ncbi:MAG: helix-turn-helix domain-containing protein [Puniceicoccales bacterium]
MRKISLFQQLYDYSDICRPSWIFMGIKLAGGISVGDYWFDFKERASVQPREAFVELIQILLDTGFPDAVKFNLIPKGRTHLHLNSYRRDGTDPVLFSSVPCPRFVLPLEGAHRMVQDPKDRRRDRVVRSGQLLWVDANDWYLLRNDVERIVFSVVFHDSYTRLVSYHHCGHGNQKARWGRAMHESVSYHTHSVPGLTLLYSKALLQESVREFKLAGDAAAPTDLLLFASKAVLAALRQALKSDDESTLSAESNVRNRTYEQICAYIAEHLQSKLDRETVAHEFGISADHLTRLFRIHSTEGYTEYVKNRRFELAEQLLRTTSLSVKEVAAACGFNVYSYFIKTFRERYGDPPSLWRKKGIGSLSPNA